MLIALWLSAAAIYILLPVDTWDTILWLLVQSLPYFSALCLSIISAFPGLALYRGRRDIGTSGGGMDLEQSDVLPPNA